MGCNVIVRNGSMRQEEINAYIMRATEKYGKEPLGIEITIDGDYVELKYDFGATPFSRIRRITGYLVGDLIRFNDAKRTEESHRIKHLVSRG